MLSFLVASALGATAALAAAAALAAEPAAPEAGVSETLARARAAAIRDLRYDVTLRIPGERTRPIEGRVVVRFSLRASAEVVLDFAQPAERIRSVRVGDRDVPYASRNGHIVVPASATIAGENAIAVEFVAGDESLNRGDDFLYTLFVPSRAQLAFPCFDQPDLKARYTLTLTLPESWQVAANAAEAAGAESSAPTPDAPGLVTRRFAETQPLPTYVFGFAAGRFSVETATRSGRVMRMLHRETDAAKVGRNKDQIFDLHAAALTWLEDYTGIAYPFGKFDFVLIPSFQFGGMEHAGAILYNAAGLMLDASATQNQLLGRASVIAHETSHMWFGDLVTMRWFNDVWTKEVFANFMAAKIVNPSFPQVNHELRFLLDHYPSAYQVDRTAGTNAVRQTLGNLNDAGQMYGPIIYDKAPVVMRQLELMVGEQAMRDGMREYLTRFSYGSATWPDLVRILDRKTSRDLAAWSRAWVDERGRPEFSTAVRLDPAGRIAELSLTQRDPLARGIVWPQRLRVTLGQAGSAKDVTVDVSARRTVVRQAAGLEAPLYVLPNGGGLGYGYFELDEASRGYLIDHVEDIADPLTRGSAWVTLWDNMLERRITPDALFGTAVRALARETDEQNAQRVLSYAVRTYWRFLTPRQRDARSPGFESALRAGLARASTQSQKAAWFNAFRDVVSSAEGVAWLHRVWSRQEQVPGLTLAEPDEIVMAFELAVRGVPEWQQILAAQLERTENPDRKARFAFVMPALSADPAERERAFERFAALENRRRESWVLDSLQYINHPLRAAHAAKLVPRALDMLREIQQTGDIFFPTRWSEWTLWGHQSPEVAAMVRGFLERNTAYPTRLRWTILSAADDLFRSAAMQPSPGG
jgi:aminopeptidase N